MQKSQRSQKKLRFFALVGLFHNGMVYDFLCTDFINKHELRTYIRFAADEGAGSL